MRIAPDDGGSSPVIRWTSVVFPAPLGPISACRAPDGSESETSCATCSAPKLLHTPTTSRMGGSAPMSALRPVEAQEADQPRRRVAHGEDQDDPEREQPVERVDRGGAVRQHDKHRSAQDGAVERAGAAEDQHDQRVAGEDELESVEADELGDLGGKAAGPAGEK